MEFIELTEQEYKAYADTSPYRNLWQSVEMCHLRESNGWTSHYLAMKDQGETVAACALVSYPVFMGYRLFQALRGFLIEYENEKMFQQFHNHIITYMKHHKGIHFSMDPYVLYRQHDKFGNLVEGGFDHHAVIEMLQKLGYTHEGFTTGVDEEHSEPRWMFALPLGNKRESDLLKGMNQLTRRSIKKTQRPGFSLVELSRNELDQYREIITHTADRRGFTDRPLSYYEKMYDIFHDAGMIKYWLIVLHTEEYITDLQKELLQETKKQKQIEENLVKHPDHAKSLNKLHAIENVITSLNKKIQEAEALQKEKGNNIILSGAMFLLYGDEVLYLTGGSYEDTMQFSAQYRLQWEMISYAAAHGFQTYNFYGISGIFDQAKQDGVLNFKQGFDGEVRELIGIFNYSLSPFLYHLYQGLRKVKHLGK